MRWKGRSAASTRPDPRRRPRRRERATAAKPPSSESPTEVVEGVVPTTRGSRATGQHDCKSDTVAFAHRSERQYARLLDFYQIEWEYEPRSFDIEWDEAGEVVKRFTPDFYLPEFDTYIEVTTMNQRLVTKKNRKVRRLREIYPDIKVKIFYQRDYVALLKKYGLEAGEAETQDAVGG